MDPSFPPAFAGAVAGATEFRTISLKIVTPAKAGVHGHSVRNSVKQEDLNSRKDYLRSSQKGRPLVFSAA